MNQCTGLSGSDRNYSLLTGRSGTQRARPLRPELAAPLGVCPLPQLMVGVGGSSCSLLSGDVAVFCCCIVTARTVQGMARVRPGQAPAWPLSSDRSVRRGSRVKHDFACTFTWHYSPVPGCPAGPVMLEAGGAGTYTQRAIPGSEPRQSHWTFPTYVVEDQVVIITSGVRVLPGKRGLGCPQPGPRRAARRPRAG